MLVVRVYSKLTTGLYPWLRCFPQHLFFATTMTHESSSVVPPTPSTAHSTSQIPVFMSQSFQPQSVLSPSPAITSESTPLAAQDISSNLDDSDDSDDDLSPILESIIVCSTVTFSFYFRTQSATSVSVPDHSNSPEPHRCKMSHSESPRTMQECVKQTQAC